MWSGTRALEDFGLVEVGGRDEEEAVDVEEAGAGVLVRRESRGGEAEPAIGERVEGEGLVVLGGGVVDVVEEEPGVGLGLRQGGGDDGLPELANEGRDREVGEDLELIRG